MASAVSTKVLHVLCLHVYAGRALDHVVQIPIRMYPKATFKHRKWDCLIWSQQIFALRYCTYSHIWRQFNFKCWFGLHFNLILFLPQHLANPESKILAILGAGVQGRSHFKALSKFFKFDEVSGLVDCLASNRDISVHVLCLVASRISGGGHRIGAIFLYVCLCVSVCEHSHGQTVWHMTLILGMDVDFDLS